MVFTLSGRMKAEEVAELKALFDADYRTIVLDLRDVRLADRDAVKFLRDCEAAWDATGELSGVRPRVDGKGKRLREPATNSSDSKEEVHRSDEYILFSAERCRSSWRSSSVERGAVDRSRQKWAKSPLRRALRTSYEKSLLCDSPDHTKPWRRGI
jgi:hypothetical protein